VGTFNHSSILEDMTQPYLSHQNLNMLVLCILQSLYRPTLPHSRQKKRNEKKDRLTSNFRQV